MTMQIAKNNLAEFTTKELLDFFNANSGEEPVKRFSDRASAERRVIAILDKKPEGKTAEPTPPAKAGKATPVKSAKATKPVTPKEKGVKKEKAPAKTPEERSAAVKGSWADGKVRAARSARHNVRVDGTLYDSVLKAFVALKLDTAPHQRVRKDLVANGRTEHEGHKFVLSPKED